MMRIANFGNLFIRIKNKFRTEDVLYKLSLHVHNVLFHLSVILRRRAEIIMAFLLNRSLPHHKNFDQKGLFRLHRDLDKLLKKQRKKLSKEEMYLHGISQYQGLDLLQIPGARITEERFKEFELYNLLSENDRVLDLGCNNGFVLIYASYIFGCQTVGVDHNKYTIEAGRKCIDFLKLQDKVVLHADTIENYIKGIQANDRFSVVISFATHHTNDGGVKEEFYDLFNKAHKLLADNGLFLFETHMSHSDDVNFNKILEEGSDLFDYVYSTYLDYIKRRFVVFGKKSLTYDATKKIDEDTTKYRQFIKAMRWGRINARYCYNAHVKFNRKRRVSKQIGIIIPSTTFFYHFYPIFKHLSKREYVCIPLNSSIDETENIYNLCATNNIPIMGVKEMFARGIIFDTLLSNAAPIGLTPDSDTPEVKSDVLSYLGVKQVKVMYAGGKVGWNFDDWNREYNYVLCYGPYYSDRYKKNFPHLKTIDIGYPRLDQLYSDFSRASYLGNLGLNPEKKTISCLLTHGDPEAYEFIADLLPKLAAYNVLIKPHPFTDLDHEKFDDDHCAILGKNEDNIDCYKVADYILVNYGGPVLAAIYADINLIIVRSDAYEAKYPENFPDENVPELIAQGALGAFETSQAKNILGVLEEDEYWVNQSNVRGELKETFFRHSKESGEYSAQVILDILNGGN